jgi:2-iminobutanoate/2-iminopropanoate deaminase
MHPLRLVPLAFVALTPLAAQDKPAVQWIAPSGPAAASLPFSPAVRVGNLLYLSGQLGTDSTNKLVAGGVEAETRQALTNIKRLLEAPGWITW